MILISLGLIAMSFLSGILVRSNNKIIINHYPKISLINMGLLLSFTIVELIPITADLSHDGLIFVVFGVLIPLLLHGHMGHNQNGEKQLHFSMKLFMVAACLHSFVDGAIMGTGLLLENSIGTVFLSSILIHKTIEMMMFSLMLFPLVKDLFKLFLYLLSLSICTILGMIISVFFLSKSGDLFWELYGIAIALSAGIFIYMSLTTISKEVEFTKQKLVTVFPFIGCVIYFTAHIFIH